MVNNGEVDELKEFAWRVVEVRNRLHLMQKDMAANLGLSISSLSQVEAGKTKPGYLFFKMMLTKYNVNPVYLLTGEGEMFMDEDKLKPVSAVAENEYGDATSIVKNMLYHIKHSVMVKSEIVECYLNYFYSNKSKIARELKESGIPLKHPKSEKK